MGSEEDKLGGSGIPGVPNTAFDIAVVRMAGKGSDAHQVRLPPLNVPAMFDNLMPGLRVSPVPGLHSPKRRGAGQFTIPVDDVDRPLEQCRDILTPDLFGAGGHLTIIGGPQSRKPTFAQTVVGALVLTRTPIEVWIYAASFDDGTFAGVRDLTHTSGVVLRSGETRVRRVLTEIKSIADDRGWYSTAQGVESMAAHRRMHAEGRTDDGYGDILLVIDGWQALRSNFDKLRVHLQGLIPHGLSFGVYVIATTLQRMNFCTAAKDTFDSRIELRLGGVLDSEIDKKLSWNVSTDAPGRGLELSKHHILSALPRVDADHNPESPSESVIDPIENVNRLWTGPRGPELRMLPDKVPIEQVRRRVSKNDRRVLLGLDESRLEPFEIDFDANSYFFFLGDQKPGKTVTLRFICSEIARLYTPQQVQIFTMSYRGSLLGELPEGYAGHHLHNTAEAIKQLNGLAQFLTTRIPGSDVIAKQLRERSWWEGPKAWIVVDDYDLIDNSQGNPVRALVPMMAQARNVDLHIITVRRMGDASRTIYDSPVIQAMNDLVSPAMLLPSNPEKDIALGRARPQEDMPGRGQSRSREINRRLIQVAWLDSAVSFD